MTQLSIPAPKEPNYTKEREAEMRKAYEAAPTRETVDMLADSYGKSPRSIIAKLSNMGIYRAPPRLTKSGTPIVKKETLVAEIMERLGVVAPSLVKANKQDLQRLTQVLRDLNMEVVE